MVKDYKMIRLEVPYSPPIQLQTVAPPVEMEEEKGEDWVNITYSDSNYVWDRKQESFNKYSTLNKVDLLPQFEQTSQARPRVKFSKLMKKLGKSKEFWG